MKKSKAVRDLLVGIFSVAVSLITVFVLIPNYIMLGNSNDGLTPSSYPTVCAWLLFGFGILQIGNVLLRCPDVLSHVASEIQKAAGSTQVRTNVLVTMGLAVLYYVLIMVVRSTLNISGFYIATPICIIAMGVWLNWRKIPVLLITALITTASIYVVFWHLLNIRVP